VASLRVQFTRGSGGSWLLRSELLKPQIAPEDFKLRFSQARQIAIGRGERFVVGFLEKVAPNGGEITVGIWRAAFSSRFSEPLHVSKRQKFLIDVETDEIAWTVGND
jgi:hypothetical protein